MTPAFRYTLLWLAGSTLAVFAALALLGGGYADGEFRLRIPTRSITRRRILDSLFSGSPVIQFDPRIHVPEGSWLVWPWGYDTLLTSITRLFGPFASEAEANRVLMNIPPAAIPIAVGLVVIIARQLALPFFLAAAFRDGLFRAAAGLHAVCGGQHRSSLRRVAVDPGNAECRNLVLQCRSAVLWCGHHARLRARERRSRSTMGYSSCRSRSQ